MLRSSLDSELFQNILASAYVIQQNVLDVQSPSGMLEVRRLIATGALGVTGAMRLIAGRARNVANASGVAIALVKKDQLVYQAGSGRVASYVGRHVIATLSVSTKVERKQEILRVEDADADSRIGAAICRQFGAKSLLVLPIYHDQALSGILEVFFDEAHTFQDREVCAYQLLAGVIEEAMSYPPGLEQKKCLAEEWPTMPLPIEELVPPRRTFQSNTGPSTSNYAFRRVCSTTAEEVEKSPRAAVTKLAYRAKRVPCQMRAWKAADRTAVIVVLVMASWIAYSYHRPTYAQENSARPKSSAIKPQQQVAFGSAKRGSVNKDTSAPPTASVPTKARRNAAGSRPRHVRVGNEEIDYVSEDVTVRHFTGQPALPQVRSGDDRVEYVSEDVTVRRFVTPAVGSPRPQTDHAAALPAR